MANKKKIEERQKHLQAKQTERLIQLAGLVAVVALVVLGVWYFSTRDAGQPVDTASGAPTQAVLDYGDATACERFADIPVAQQYSAPPQAIEVSKQYFATVKLEKGGEFVIQLYPDKAPITVNSFIFLACKGYFDGVTFHRVLEGFMAQGGDPTGTGGGGPGYYFEYEPNDFLFDKPGLVAMANRGAATPTNGSQFFITFGPAEFLNGGYTIFGQVVEGMDVVNGITRRDPDQSPAFPGDTMESVTIAEN